MKWFLTMPFMALWSNLYKIRFVQQWLNALHIHSHTDCKQGKSTTTHCLYLSFIHWTKSIKNCLLTGHKCHTEAEGSGFLAIYLSNGPLWEECTCISNMCMGDIMFNSTLRCLCTWQCLLLTQGQSLYNDIGRESHCLWCILQKISGKSIEFPEWMSPPTHNST